MSGSFTGSHIQRSAAQPALLPPGATRADSAARRRPGTGEGAALRYRFEGFEVLEDERQLHIGGVPVAVGARAFDVLMVLVLHRDRVVAKSELLDRVWPGMVVEENNVQVQVSSLRKLLGAAAIATIPGRGYRLAVRALPDPALAAPLADAAGAVPAADAGPSPAPGPARSNLPLHLPALYGRDAELAQVSALLDVHPVVSLVATAGVGKTHLARAVAGALRGRFAGGVWSVELAELSHGGLVAPELARVLGFQLAEGRSPTETVVDVLRQQHALLLLDNCEHVLDAVADLVRAIQADAPQVRVLVTSQEPLKIPGEHVLRLDTLALPDGPGLAAARASGAVQLLEQRIRAALPGFALTEDNAGRVAALCARLDGIPLALELAAARVPVLGLEGLLARLDERFKVLTGGRRGGLARHQTLQAALAFSHGLLGADAQAVFRRLGVFAGTFSADAAQDVASDAAIDRWAVLDHLGTLVDKSMVLADRGDPPRLRLLESTHAFALQRLADAGESAAWRARHAQAVGRLVAAGAQDHWVLSDAQMLARYGAEHANLRAALDWSLQHDPALAIALAGNACGLWREAMSLQPEGARYCEAALPLLRADTPPLAAGRLWYAQGWMLIWSQQQRARAAALRAAELLRQADDPATLGMTLLLLIPGTTAPDAHQAAVLEEMRLLHDPRAPARVRAQYVSASARYAMGARRYDDASRLYAEARALLAGCGAVQWEGVLAWTMAGIAMATGQLGFAARTLAETAARLDAQPVRGLFLGFCLGSQATVQLQAGDPAAARAALARAAPLIVRYDLGSRYAATAAWLAMAEGRWAAAARLLAYGRHAAARSGVDAEEPAEVTARQRVQEALDQRFPAEQLADWAGDGPMLSTADAYRLALARTDDPDTL